MEVTVRLFAYLRRQLPAGSVGGQCCLSVARGARVEQVLSRLGLGGGAGYLLLVNGRHAGRTDRLAAGDVVSIFPPIAGG